jgi:group I intron endonuclease
MIVYLLRNVINGKCYVGQTITSLEERWSKHKWSAKNRIKGCTLLWRAVRKYGDDCFEHCVLASADTLLELNRLEIYYIKKLRTLEPSGYNLHLGGKNHNVTKQTRLRLSKALRGKKRTVEQKKRYRLSQLGKKLSSESIAKRTVTRLSRGRWNKNKYRSDFGKHRVGKALRNIRAALKRRSDA